MIAPVERQEFDSPWLHGETLGPARAGQPYFFFFFDFLSAFLDFFADFLDFFADFLSAFLDFFADFLSAFFDFLPLAIVHSLGLVDSVLRD